MNGLEISLLVGAAVVALTLAIAHGVRAFLRHRRRVRETLRRLAESCGGLVVDAGPSVGMIAELTVDGVRASLNAQCAQLTRVTIPAGPAESLRVRSRAGGPDFERAFKVKGRVVALDREDELLMFALRGLGGWGVKIEAGPGRTVVEVPRCLASDAERLSRFVRLSVALAQRLAGQDRKLDTAVRSAIEAS